MSVTRIFYFDISYFDFIQLLKKARGIYKRRSFQMAQVGSCGLAL